MGTARNNSINENKSCTLECSVLTAWLHTLRKASKSFIHDKLEISKIGWLPLQERREFHLLKQAFKSIYCEHWPSYLRLSVVNHERVLRSSSSINLKIPMEKGTFQDSAAKSFNKLPSDIRNTKNFSDFCKKALIFLKNRTQ